MTVAFFQIGGPAAENEWLVLFFIVGCVATAVISGYWLDRKGKRLERKQAVLDKTSDSIAHAMLEGRCLVCRKRQDDVVRPYNWADDSGDAA